MNEQKRKHLPIGYWLKRADELLTKQIDEAQQANGLTRLAWQILNVIKQGEKVQSNEIINTLSPFADATVVQGTLAELTRQDLISRVLEDRFDLTPAGAKLYEKALLPQQAIRQQAIAGISEHEYVTTIAVLQQLVENLENLDAT